MYYLICGCLGLLSGLVFYYLAIHHVSVRSQYDNGEKLKLLKNKKFALVWMIAGAIIFTVVAVRHLEGWLMVRALLFVLLAWNVSAIDIMIRKIPNAILLGMLLLEVVNIAIEGYYGGNLYALVQEAFVGMFLAYIVFVIPTMLSMSIGGGDVKYGAVIGFTLGFQNYMQAMLIMAISVLIYFIYLKITKTGGMKTAAPMAPFLSIGTLIALMYPMF